MSWGTGAEFVGRFLDALLLADRRGAADIVNDAFANGATGVEVLDELITPAMYEVGRLWENGTISIADEHLATVISHQILPIVFPHLTGTGAATRRRILLAGTDGEQHVLGLRMIADVLEASGYDVRNAGPSLPVDALLAAVRRHAPHVVGLSNTMPMFSENLGAAVAAVRAAEPDVTVLVGGGAVDPSWAVDDRVIVCTSAAQTISAIEHLDD